MTASAPKSLVVPVREARRNARAVTAHEPRVYFAACDGRVKVGTSINIPARLSEISSYLPVDLILIGSVSGGVKLEHAIHRHLVAHRLRREWYRDSDEIREAIAAIITNGGVRGQASNAKPPKTSGNSLHARKAKLDRDPTAELLEILKDAPRDELMAIAERAGVFSHVVGRAAIGNTVSVVHYLRICAAIGLDPMTRGRREISKVGDFDCGLFALGVNMARRLKGHSLRAAATAAQTSYSTVLRAENHDIVSTIAVLCLCSYIGSHPFGYCAPDVARETGETLHSRLPQQVEHA